MSIDHYSGPASTVFEGLTSAIERVGGSSIRSDQIAIGESLFWAITLDEMLSKRHGAQYDNARDAHPLGATISGARLARNAIAHGMVIVQSIQGGLTFPMTFPLTFGEPAWLEIDRLVDLASPKPTRWLAIQKASYAAHFDGRRPIEPLFDVRGWIIAASESGFLL